MIAIVNYGSGNTRAIANIYQRLKIPTLLASLPADLDGVDRIILPGVGSFDQTMQQLLDSGMREALEARVLRDGLPFLGICVGMQLLAKRSDEGTLPGLGWIDAEVKRFDDARFHQRTHLPHMGWNDEVPVHEDPLFAGFQGGASFYFLHSYYMRCNDAADVLAETEYGGRFTCAVRRRNIWGVQFHPEKSHAAGVRLLENFASA